MRKRVSLRRNARAIVARGALRQPPLGRDRYFKGRMNLRGVAIIVVGVAFACGCEGADPGLYRDPGSPVGMTASAGIPGTGGSAGPGGSGGSSASSPPSAESGGNAGSGAVSDGGGSAGSGLELDEIAESPAAGNLQGIWSLVSAHALEVGDGFQVRLYREPLPDSGEFVPTQNYVRLTEPVPGDFEVDLTAQNEDGLSATFVVCNQLGSPCVAAASMPEYATGRIVVQVDGSGLLNGGINLSSGSDAIDGSFAGVETYAAA